LPERPRQPLCQPRTRVSSATKMPVKAQPMVPIDRGKRLIKQQQFWLDHDGARQGAALLHAARELPWIQFGSMFQIDRTQGSPNALIALAPVEIVETEGDVSPDRKPWKQAAVIVLKNDRQPVRRVAKSFALMEDRAGIRLHQGGTAAQQGGFSATRRPDDREKLSGLLFERQPLQNGRHRAGIFPRDTIGLRKQNVDVQSVTFREIPFPDMLAALRNNTVAAVGATEPFITFGKEQGARVLGYYFTDVQSPVVLSGVVAMIPYVEKNKDLVKRFVGAINRAIDDFNSDPSIARKTIAANTKIPPAVIEKMGLGKWQTDVPPEQIQFWVDAAKKEGVISATTDLKSLIWQDK
jgi:hypothetical protein